MSTPKSSSPSHARYTVMAYILALTAISYLDRVCISTTAPSIKKDLGLSDGQMGYIFSAFTLAYALFEVPCGWLADRFGPRLMLARVVIWWSLLTAATGWAWGFASLFIIRLLFGMGEAGTFPGLARVYSRWIPNCHHGKVFGLAVMAAALGGAFTQPLVVWMLGIMEWRKIFVIFAMVGMAWAILWYWWFRDDPHHHPSVNEDELKIIGSHPPSPHPAVPWEKLFPSRNLWAICLMYFCTIYGWYFYLTWLPTYLMNERGFNLKQAGWLASLPLLGIAGGVFIGGWLSDHLVARLGLRWGRKISGMVSMPLAALCIVAAIHTPHPKLAAIFLAGAAALASLGVASGWAACLDIGGIHAGVVSGAMNTFGNLGGALSPIVTGLCLDRFHSYDAPLFSVAALYLLGSFAWFWIDANQHLLKENKT